MRSVSYCMSGIYFHAIVYVWERGDLKRGMKLIVTWLIFYSTGIVGRGEGRGRKDEVLYCGRTRASRSAFDLYAEGIIL